MNNYPKHIKSTLHSVIRDMAKHPEDFCYCPEKDFTRKRKLPFEKVLTLLVKMGGHSLRDEMLDSLGFKEVPAIARKGWKYLIRLRESRGILSGISLPDGDFDITVQLYLTRKQTNSVKKLQKQYPGTYRFLPTKVNFDYLPIGTEEFYPISFRIVRFKISEESTETLITNLTAKDFSAEELKQLYRMRWGIETSFRQLKYTVGLSLFQSKKVESITQEIFARLTMYNFCELITSHVVIQKKRGKHVYQTNFTAAVHICRQFLRGDVAPPKVEALISSYVVPIRPGRYTPRRASSTASSIG